jgi:NAD(P)-dependent dehydrogenase (short-subunit alcohol dehydrogenase family)
LFKKGRYSRRTKICGKAKEKNIKTKLIVAISSGAALAPKLGWFLYCSSKAALKFLLESYAIEHKKFKFINISPGLIKTKMQKQICKINEKKIKSVKKFKELNKKNMVPSPNEVADNLINSIKLLKKKW